MKRILSAAALMMLLLVTGGITAFGQISSNAPLAGVVSDPSGAVVPGATVVVKNKATGATFNTTAADNGTFVVPSLNPGTYTVTVTATGFKQAVADDVRILAATPASVKIVLQVGTPSETVLVQGGAEILQTQTAAVASTVIGRQITELPLPWRDSTNLALLFPGANTTGAVRSTTFLGLPSSAVNIMVDGVNTQEQYYKNYNDFFGFVSARTDAIEEATVTTAATSADSAGQGAVQLKFVTRQGSNAYHGSLYEYFRNTKLNANYWFNNRDLPANPNTGKAPRNKIRLNQAGGRVGGPISLPKALFGPLGFEGRDRMFFFVNVENYSLPTRNTRQRTILTPQTQQGFFLYRGSGGAVQQADMMALASAGGQTATLDPVVAKLLEDIRKTTSQGSVLPMTDPNLQQFTYLAAAEEHHIYPTARLDFNLTSKHHLEYTGNIQRWRRYKDAVNSADPNFPGFPNYGDTTSTRYSHSAAVRSTLTNTLVNEARVGLTGGALHFYENISPADFNGSVANQKGFSLGINAADGITTATFSRSPSRRNSPLWTFTDNLTKQLDTHSLSFGATLTSVKVYTLNHTTVPSISFGVDTTYDPARVLFDATNQSSNFPGASSSDVSTARGIYSVLTGRVTQIGGTAYLSEETGKYVYNGDRTSRGRQQELGLYAQDAWRWKPNLTINFGVRWQLQFPFTPLNDNFSTATFADLYGISGPGNLFKPGVLAGRDTQFLQFKRGDQAFPMKYLSLGPTVGFAWTPNLGHGLLRHVFGEAGGTVLRGGYSVAFNQPSIGTFVDFFSSNPGGSYTATRSVANGNLVSGQGSDVWPLLFRQTERLGPPSFPNAPAYPFIGAPTDSLRVYSPEMKIPYVQSWNLGLQREFGKNMAVEFRYVGNVDLQELATFSLNETNWQDNGFYGEFKLAQANLLANVAAGRGNTFKYSGPNTGTSPLPITLAYFSGIPAASAGDTSKYTSTNFTSTTFVNPLTQTNPNPSSFAESLYSDPNRRANALAAGLPPNLFLVNPGLLGGVSYRGNGGYNRYNSGVIEVRRRMSQGLMMQASYTLAKGSSSSFISLRKPRANVANTGVVAHTLRTNWIYELPFGSGKPYLNATNKVINLIVAGWQLNGVLRLQSGPQFNLGNVRLVGMTRDELQQAIDLRFDDAQRIVYLLPQDIIDNTIRANNTSATTATGYSSRGVPTGRYIAPANSANCTELYTGDCGGTAVVVHGRPFTRVDLSLVRRTRISESKNFELRAEFLNAFNFINFTTNSLTSVGGYSSASFGQINQAYRDIANANETGGRMVQLVARFNF